MNKNLPLITIIINNYNNKRFIEKAILSAINQTYTNLQIIIQDDNSTEKETLEIYEKYRKIDSRIEVHHNEKNLQIFASRVKSIENIKGQYACFMDGDDYYDFDFVRHMYYFLLLKNADVTVCMFAYVIENDLYIDKNIKSIRLEYTKEENPMIDFLVDTKAGSFFQNLNWNKLYKSELLFKAREKIVQNGWENIKLYASEDFFLNLAIFSFATKICIDEKFIGNYYRRSGALELKNMQEKLSYLAGLNEVYQLTYEGYMKQIVDKKNSVLFQDYKATIIRTFSQYLYMFQLDDSHLDFDKIIKYLSTDKEQIPELRKEIELNSNQWLIPNTFKYKNKINDIKKLIINAKNIKFNLANGLYIFPNKNEIRETGEIETFINNVVLNYLNLALYYNKKVDIICLNTIEHNELVNNLKEIISKWNIPETWKNLTFVKQEEIPQYNVQIDDLEVDNFDLDKVLLKSMFKNLIQQQTNFKDEIIKIFKIAVAINKDYYDFYEKSIFNFSYQLYYLIFISLEIQNGSIQTFANSFQIFIKNLYITPKNVFSDSFFDLQNKKALVLNATLLKIVSTYYPELQKKEIADELFQIFFNKLAFWFESSNVIPHYVNWMQNDGNLIYKPLINLWQKNAKPCKGFRNFHYGIYNIPILRQFAYCVTNQDIFSNQVFRFLRTHHRLFKLILTLIRRKIKND